jgi:hypothetical protein
MVSVPSRLSSGVFCSWLLEVLPLLPSLAGLFIYSSVRDCPSPPSVVRTPRLLFYVSFLVVVVYYSVCFLFLFFLGGGQSVQGTMLIWPRIVCKSTTCHLAHLVVCISPASRKWHMAAWEPFWFLCLSWSGDAMRRLGVWRSQSFASSQWFFL